MAIKSLVGGCFRRKRRFLWPKMRRRTMYFGTNVGRRTMDGAVLPLDKLSSNCSELPCRPLPVLYLRRYVGRPLWGFAYGVVPEEPANMSRSTRTIVSNACIRCQGQNRRVLASFVKWQSAPDSDGFMGIDDCASLGQPPALSMTSTSSRTASAERRRAADSSEVRSNSTISSTPLAPSLTGTPTKSPSMPYSPSR